MVGPFDRKPVTPSGATRRTAVGLILGAPLLGACAGVQQSLSQFSNPFSSSQPDGVTGLRSSGPTIVSLSLGRPGSARTPPLKSEADSAILSANG
jgi:hypothetical protein